jgi:hypothetical protein
MNNSNGSDHYAGLEDMFGKMSHMNFHFVCLSKNTDLSWLYLWQSHTFKSKSNRLRTKICFEPAKHLDNTLTQTVAGDSLGGYVNFWWFPGGVLDYQK